MKRPTWLSSLMVEQSSTVEKAAPHTRCRFAQDEEGSPMGHCICSSAGESFEFPVTSMFSLPAAAVCPFKLWLMETSGQSIWSHEILQQHSLMVWSHRWRWWEEICQWFVKVVGQVGRLKTANHQLEGWHSQRQVFGQVALMNYSKEVASSSSVAASLKRQCTQVSTME